MRYRHQVVDVELVDPNPWNPNQLDAEGEKKLDRSIERLGVFKPIIVRENSGRLEVIGGQHRWESAKRLGFKEIPVVNLGDLDDSIAKEIGLADNGRWGMDDPTLLAEVFDSLDIEELTQFLPISDTEIELIYTDSTMDVSDLDLDDDDIDLDPGDDSKHGPTHKIMRFKVPVLDAELISERVKQIQKEQGFTESDSLTNAGDALVYMLGVKL